jgi:hypothetical protein
MAHTNAIARVRAFGRLEPKRQVARTRSSTPPSENVYSSSMMPIPPPQNHTRNNTFESLQNSLLELSFVQIEHVAQVVQTVLTDRQRDGVTANARTRVLRTPVMY